MARAAPALTNFTAGELSPLLDGRVDLSKYFNGCRTLQNMIIHPHGAVSKRGGSRYVAAAKTGKVRLIPFQFSIEQAYVLEFGNLYIRFYKDRGRIETGGAPYEIASPYAEADLFEIKFTQSADTMYLVHPDYAPRKLTRAGHTSWTLTAVAFGDGPYLESNSEKTLTITPSAATGNITLTASAALFESGHVGALWRLRHNGDNVHTDFSGDGQYSSAVILKNSFYLKLIPDVEEGFSGKITLQKSFDGSTWADVSSITSSRTDEFFEDENGVYYRVVCKTGDFTAGACAVHLYQDDKWGVVQITGFVSSTEVTGTVLVPIGNALDGAATLATPEWREGAWSSVRGYPRCVTFFEDRLWFAGTDHQPQTVWSSKVGDYENLVPGVQDDSALTFTLLSDQVNAILWMVPKDRLVLGAIDGEHTLGASNPDDPVTATNVRAKRHTTYGSNDVPPRQIGTAVLFVQRSGRKVRELVYSVENDSFVAPDLTLLAEHITAGGIVDLAYQQEPDSIVWCVRADGSLLGMTYLRAEEVIGWQRHVTDGTFESVASIQGSGRDEVWISVNRTLNGVATRCIEYIEGMRYGIDYTDQEDGFFVDCGLSYDGVAATTISGLDHLEGKTVSVLADGATHPDCVVDSGSITLERAAAVVHVGLLFTPIVETMRLEAGAADGTSQGKIKRIHEATIRFLDTLGAKFGMDADHLEVMPFRKAAYAMDEPPPLFSGDMRVTWPTGYEEACRIYITQDQPLPLTVLAIYPRLTTYDK